MGTRILLVASELVSRRKISHFLASGGYTVTEADSGRSALNFLQTLDFDLIVSDLHLIDGVEGIEVLACAAGLQPGVIPVLLGRPSDLPRQNFVDAAFVSKPVRLEELRLKIGLLLIHQTRIPELAPSTRKMIDDIRSRRAASVIQGLRFQELCARLEEALSRNLQLRQRALELRSQIWDLSSSGSMALKISVPV